MFVVSLTYLADLSEVDRYLQEHVEFLERYYASGHFLASGPKVPRDGGMILVEADDRETLDRILTEDPFFQHSVAKYDVTEFIANRTTAALSHLKQG